MEHIVAGLIIIALLCFIWYALMKEGFFAHYTSGGKQRYASEFTGTNQGEQSISASAFTDEIFEADYDILEQKRAEAVSLGKNLGEVYNKDVRKNLTRTENFSQNTLPSLVLESILNNRNIGESDISGTEILLQDSLYKVW